jgi:beta-N-acetylhexosaminidase
MTKAAIVGLAGTTLSPAERNMLLAHQPAGVILFGRNVGDPDQLIALTTAVRSVLGQEAILMVDQEGGRVARLRPPHWQAHPPAAELTTPRAAWLTGALIGLDCAAAGLNVVCAPVLDLRIPGAHDVIGDRAFSSDAAIVAANGRAMALGLLAAGIQPVLKHIPGHGRATADSHLELPRVEASDLAADLLPFIANADLPWAMTAHILYPGWDSALPATLSREIISQIIRGRIGFSGMLVSDDLAMHALSGTPAGLAADALTAGCDVVLHCTGEIAETMPLLQACPSLTDTARHRLQVARDQAAGAQANLDAICLLSERSQLLA